MDLEILGKTQDLRTGSRIIYGQISIDDYLELIGDNFDMYGIQRKREKHRAYSRMKQDITEGAVLPTITLAINQNVVSKILELLESGDDENLLTKLKEPGNFSILDGLQRTNILKDLKSEETKFKEGQKLLLEFWVETNIKHLIYRLIVLNAGQKPMTMRHQLELLFMSLDDLLKKEIPGIEFFKEVDQRRRSKAKQYQFDRLVTSYQSFLMKTTELKKDNLVAQQLIEESILDSNEEELNNSFRNFIEYLKQYVRLDELACSAHSQTEAEGKSSRDNGWLASENVMISFFAAVSDFAIDPKREERIKKAIQKLFDEFNAPEPDPFALETYNQLIKGFETSKVNVGVATRKLLFNGFKEYFREEGDKCLKDCWISEAK